MNHTQELKLELVLNVAEGALIRTLGLIERRGHRVLSSVLRPREAATNVQKMELVIDCGGRCKDVLMRQLQRLYDVLSVNESQPPVVQRVPLKVLPSLVQNQSVTQGGVIHG